MRFVQMTSLRLAVALGLLAPISVFAGGLGERFSLSKAVPQDCWLYVHAVKNPERAWIDQQWEGVFDALAKSGIQKDLVSMVMSVIPEAKRGEAQATVDKVTTLLNGVQWGKLVENEFVFAERFAPTALWIDYIFIAQNSPGSAESNFAGIAAILKEAASAFGATTTQSTIHDVDVWELSHEGFAKIGMSLGVFRSGDTIGMTTSRKALEEIIGLLRGKSDAKSITDAPRFKEAISSVKAPEDVISYFDFQSFIGSFGKMFDTIAAMKQGPDKGADGKEGVESPELAILKKVLNQLNVFEYSITTVATDGRREFRYDVTKIQSGKEKSPLAASMLNRKPFEQFDQFIPADATGFNLTGFIDLGVVYDAILDFVRKEIPEGAAGIEKWNSQIAAFGFDPKADFFDWWSGEMISVSMPPAIVTPMGGSDGVLMIRTRDSALAKAKVDGFINFVKDKLQGEGQMLMISDAKVEGGGFQEITHPSIAMFLKLVIGVRGDWLVLGTSSGAVSKCMDVAAGKTPSIVKNARFAEEGLIPKGPVQGASFTDTSKFGQELGAAAGMVGMFGGMAVAGMPETNDDERTGKRIVQSLLGTLMKLGPVLQKIDFYSSESSISTFDGKLTLRKDSVVTYKKPKETDAKSAEASKSKE